LANWMHSKCFICPGVWTWKMTRSLVPGWTHLRVHQSKVAESWNLKARSRLSTLERGRGSIWKTQD
jgi:hypothetical protein